MLSYTVAVEEFDYFFAENGLTAYKLGKQLPSQSFIKFVGEERYGSVYTFNVPYDLFPEAFPHKSLDAPWSESVSAAAQWSCVMRGGHLVLCGVQPFVRKPRSAAASACTA